MEVGISHWKRDYEQLIKDLTDCKVEYTYGSGRKFYLPGSPDKKFYLSAFENRARDLFEKGKKALSNSCIAKGIEITACHTARETGYSASFLKSHSYLSERFDGLRAMQEHSDILFGGDFRTKIMGKIAGLDVNSDAEFYDQSQPSLCFRIVLFIHRFFGNLFKTAHADLPTVFANERNSRDFFGKEFLLQREVRLNRAKLATVVNDRLWTLKGRSDQSLSEEITKLEGLLKKLIHRKEDDAENGTQCYGITFTRQEVRILGEDEFFAHFKAASERGEPGFTPGMIDDLNGDISSILRQYSPFEKEALAICTPEICAKMSVIVAREFYTAQQI